MRQIDEFCCQNIECSDYGKRGVHNLRWHGWSGKRQDIRMIYCRTCKAYFSQRKGTALWRSRLPQDKAIAVLQHVSEGCGVRQTARLVKVDKNTVSRLTARAGDHARRVHDQLVPVSPLDS